jgi:nucleotide-binding universal stress UspA family protein
MFTHILSPVDGSELSMGAARHAVDFAELCEAELTVLMVSPTYRQASDEGFVAPTINIIRERWEDQMNERAKTVLDKIASEASGAGVKCATVHLFADTPYESIISIAKKNGCDVIVMGSHGYGGFKQFILGSETTRVLSHSKIPVLVYR